MPSSCAAEAAHRRDVGDDGVKMLQIVVVILCVFILLLGPQESIMAKTSVNGAIETINKKKKVWRSYCYKHTRIVKIG